MQVKGLAGGHFFEYLLENTYKLQVKLNIIRLLYLKYSSTIEKRK